MDKHKKQLCRILKKYHKGRENAIISKQLKHSVGIKESGIRYLVSVLRREGEPICSCCEGYFYPETFSEVVETVDRFEKYLDTLSDTSANLLSSYMRI